MRTLVVMLVLLALVAPGCAQMDTVLADEPELAAVLERPDVPEPPPPTTRPDVPEPPPPVPRPSIPCGGARACPVQP